MKIQILISTGKSADGWGTSVVFLSGTEDIAGSLLSNIEYFPCQETDVLRTVNITMRECCTTNGNLRFSLIAEEYLGVDFEISMPIRQYSPLPASPSQESGIQHSSFSVAPAVVGTLTIAVAIA